MTVAVFSPQVFDTLVDTYHIWCDLKAGVKEKAFVASLHEFLGHLKEEGHIAAYRIQRRKLGFGPDALGDWNIQIETEDMAQLEEAFQMIVPREGKMEKLHAPVWSKGENHLFALYRDV